MAFDNTNFWNTGFATPAGEALLQVDPQFVDPDGGDYRLAATSPMIDVGTASGAPSHDLAGVMRPQGAGFDLGAYEFMEPVADAGTDASLADGGSSDATTGRRDGQTPADSGPGATPDVGGSCTCEATGQGELRLEWLLMCCCSRDAGR